MDGECTWEVTSRGDEMVGQRSSTSSKEVLGRTIGPRLVSLT